MNDLIERQKALDAIVNLTCYGIGEMENLCKASIADSEGWLGGILEAVHELQALPSAEPERKKGKWTEKEVFTSGKGKIREWQTAKCSVCGKYHTTPYLYYFGDYNFCPMCGAEMTRGE